MDNENLLKTFGLNLRFERIRLGLSQEKVAEILDLSTVYLSNIEAGKHSISLINAYKLANFYKKDINYLLKEKE